jgi:hypothetical protein
MHAGNSLEAATDNPNLMSPRHIPTLQTRVGIASGRFWPQEFRYFAGGEWRAAHGGSSKLVLEELSEVRSNKSSFPDPAVPTSDGKVMHGRLIALPRVVDQAEVNGN